MKAVKVDAVLFERSPGEWVAQFLQYDIGAQAGNLPDLLYELQRSIVGHIVICLENGIKPLESLPEAPVEYWEKWNKATAVIRENNTPFPTPEDAPRVIPRFKIAA